MRKQTLIENLLRTHQFVGDADALVDQCTTEPLANVCFGVTLLHLGRETKYVGDFRDLRPYFWSAWGTFLSGFVFVLGLIFLTS
jgi:hypothetical protein